MEVTGRRPRRSHPQAGSDILEPLEGGQPAEGRCLKGSRLIELRPEQIPRFGIQIAIETGELADKLSDPPADRPEIDLPFFVLLGQKLQEFFDERDEAFNFFNLLGSPFLSPGGVFSGLFFLASLPFEPLDQSLEPGHIPLSPPTDHGASQIAAGFEWS